MPDQTLFEKIIAGEVPAELLHEDDVCVAIADIQPQAPTHLLVIPRRPIPTLNDLTPDDAATVGHLFLVARDLMDARGHRDYRAVFNCGEGAGQSVFHLHLHVLAGRDLAWPPG